MPARFAQLRVGTSGWIYKHWKALFYAGVPQKRWLEHYAAAFDTVEVNNWFYRKPTEAAVGALPPRVPGGFLFAPKMWRGITHYRKLKDAADLLEKFMPPMHALPPQSRGPLLVQLPGNLHLNLERLDQFLGDLKRASDRPGWRVAVEFRHPSWLTPQTNEVLDAHRAALCLADMPKCPVTEPNAGAAFVYVRRHGTWGNYDGAYLPEHVAADAANANRWRGEGRDVFVYYNNDIGGHAVTNARELLAAAG